MNSQPNPYEENWPVLKDIFESDGAEALVTFITSRTELLERRALFLMSSQRISQGQDLARNLDDVITITSIKLKKAFNDLIIANSKRSVGALS